MDTKIYFLIFTTLFVVCKAAPPLDRSEPAKILKYDYKTDEDGGYTFEYETSDGQKRSEQGIVVFLGEGKTTFAVYGSYSYIGDDGKTYEVSYKANDDGFQPTGDHLPGNPPEELIQPPQALPPNTLLSLIG